MQTRALKILAVMASSCLLLSTPASAQWSIDLATTGEQEFQVPAGTETEITILNKVPKANYHVTAILRSIPIPALETVQLPTLEAVSRCEGLLKAAKGIDDATEESAVRDLIRQIESGLPTATCNAAEQAYLRAVMGGTVQRLPVRYVIRDGQELVVTVQRLKADNAVEKTWKLTLTTGTSGSWRTLYGLAISPDRDDDPFLTPGENEGEFFVNPGRSEDRSGHPLKPSASVFFTWMSRTAELGPLSFSPTLGVGATSELPGLFGGVAVTFRQNIALVVGVPFVPQRRVKDRYIDDPLVTSALTTEDLTETKYYFDKWFIGGVFRFSSNPFSKKEPATEKPAAEKPAEQKPGTALKPNPKG